MELSIGDAELARVQPIAREPTRWMQRARIRLGYCADASSYTIGVAVAARHQTIECCVARANKVGIWRRSMAALDLARGTG